MFCDCAQASSRVCWKGRHCNINQGRSMPKVSVGQTRLVGRHEDGRSFWPWASVGVLPNLGGGVKIPHPRPRPVFDLIELVALIASCMTDASDEHFWLLLLQVVDAREIDCRVLTYGRVQWLDISKARVRKRAWLANGTTVRWPWRPCRVAGITSESSRFSRLRWCQPWY